MKYEIQISKSETNSKSEFSNDQNNVEEQKADILLNICCCLGHSNFDHLGLFRISDFELRIFHSSSPKAGPYASELVLRARISRLQKLWRIFSDRDILYTPYFSTESFSLHEISGIDRQP